MSSGRQVGRGQVALGIAAALAGIVIATVLARRTLSREASRQRLPAWEPFEPPAPTRPAESGPNSAPAVVIAGRRLNRAAGLLAFSVLTDSTVEHYRGAFKNKAMVAPLVVGALALGVSLHGVADPRHGRHLARHLVYVAAAATGLTGTGFHIYNVTKRPGGVAWQNLFYGAPVGAPAALLLAGLLGAVAESVRGTSRDARPRILGVPAGRAMAALTAVGLAGTTGEAALLHFRGAYHDPFMVLPVTLPPVASALLAAAALDGRTRTRRFTRWWLRLVSVMGLAGSGFHAYGVGRNMGGWRNWTQNVLNGPPLPAPPSFTGLALAGLASIALIEDHPDA